MLVLLACTAVAYLPVFWNGFVFDDDRLILQSGVIHDWRNLPALFARPAMYASAQYSGGPMVVDTYRPVTLATFMWDSQLSGTHPWAYHLTNLLGHLACVWLVYRLSRVMLAEADRDLAWVGAAWFAFAPIPAEAHVWVNGRSDVFAALFGISALLAWRRGLAAFGLRRGVWLSLAAFGFLCGLLSKEVLLACVPVLVLWPEPARVGIVRRALRVWPFAAAGGVYLALRLQALGGMRTHEGAAQMQRALWHLPCLLIDALTQSLLPTRPYLRMMFEEYQRLPGYAPFAAAAALALIAALAIKFRRSAPAAGWGLAWFALPLVPVAIISTMYWPGFGRYLYVPCIGLALTVSTLAARLWRGRASLRRVWLLTFAAYQLIALWILQDTIASYRDGTTLYVRSIQFRPDLGYGYGLLAASMATRLHDLDKVVELLELAAARDPNAVRYEILLAQTQLVRKQPQRATAAAEHALKRFPNEAQLHYLAGIGRGTAQPEAALRHLLRCLELQPGFARCHEAIEQLRALRQP